MLINTNNLNYKWFDKEVEDPETKIKRTMYYTQHMRLESHTDDLLHERSFNVVNGDVWWAARSAIAGVISQAVCGGLFQPFPVRNLRGVLC